jgi:DNA-binding HxlR family transcriptional regulator
MSRSAYESELEKRAEFFKALSHPTRLLIINLIRQKPRHGEELAAILQLNPATISHHLSLMAEVGLLRSQKDQYYQTYSLVTPKIDQTIFQMLDVSNGEFLDVVDANAYEEKVLKAFFKRGRLMRMPAQLKKQQIILAKIARQFEPERTYTEKEVNVILLDLNDDVAVLRRGLVENGLMEREGGIYRRKKN